MVPTAAQLDQIVRGVIMADLTQLGKTFQIIMKGFMDTGHAPHYTEIASKLGVAPDEGRQRLHELIGLQIPGCWLYPNTSLIASFAPFNNIPTQYRIAIEGKQKWFGQ
ncbi:MAG TPA: hypothetical protein VK463_05415 [Desulfomonilaceae bacterium]|nr:hypothetical protein [Desulfomonilaceae bacterium]